jgi:hypothetical protein
MKFLMKTTSRLLLLVLTVSLAVTMALTELAKAADTQEKVNQIVIQNVNIFDGEARLPGAHGDGLQGYHVDKDLRNVD